MALSYSSRRLRLAGLAELYTQRKPASSGWPPEMRVFRNVSLLLAHWCSFLRVGRFWYGVRNMPYKPEGLARPTVAASLVDPCDGGFE